MLYSYPFGFNGQERETEINPSVTTATFWEYDGRLGRRWNRDPKTLAFESTYSVLANSPLLYVDPLGDFRTKIGAKIYAKFNGGGEVKKAGAGDKKHAGEWFVGKQVEYKGEGVGVAYQRVFDRGNQSLASNIWNSGLRRGLTGDARSFHISTTWAAAAGFTGDVAVTWMLTGKDASLFPYINYSYGAIATSEASFSVDFLAGKTYWIDDVNKLTADELLAGPNAEVGVGFGVNEVIKLNVVGAVELGLDDADKVNSITTKVGVSAGAGVSVIPIGEVSYSATMGSKPVHTKPIRQKKKKTK